MQGLNWRNILYAVLGVILPLIFKEIITADPNFPVTEEIFVKLVLYLLAFLVGGWNLVKLGIQRMVWLKYGVNYEQWIKK